MGLHHLVIIGQNILLDPTSPQSPRPSPPRHQANQQANKKNHLFIAPLCIRMYGMEDNLVFVNSKKKKSQKTTRKDSGSNLE